MNHKSIIPAQFSSFSRKGKALLALVPLLLLGACDKENDTDIQQPGDPQKIRIEITQATATPSDTSPQTRVATDLTTCESTWTNGDKVGLYIVKGTAPPETQRQLGRQYADGIQQRQLDVHPARR